MVATAPASVGVKIDRRMPPTITSTRNSAGQAPMIVWRVSRALGQLSREGLRPRLRALSQTAKISRAAHMRPGRMPAVNIEPMETSATSA